MRATKIVQSFPVVVLGLALLAASTADVRAATAAKTTAAKKPRTTATAKPSQTPLSRDPYVGAIAIDAATGKVLFEDQADAKAHPASVLKLMDLLIILEKIEQRQLSMQDQVTVSVRAS